MTRCSTPRSSSTPATSAVLRRHPGLARRAPPARSASSTSTSALTPARPPAFRRTWRLDPGPLLYAVGDRRRLLPTSSSCRPASGPSSSAKIVFQQEQPEEMHANTDIGDGIEPLRVHAYLDTSRRHDRSSTDELLQAQAIADITLDPLPQQISSRPESARARTRATPPSSPVRAPRRPRSSTVVNAEVRQAGVPRRRRAAVVRGTYCAHIERVDLAARTSSHARHRSRRQRA